MSAANWTARPFLASWLSVVLVVSLAAVPLTGCANVERAETAAKAQAVMVGLPKPSVLACMGVPSAKMAEGDIEVWSYNTGNGEVDSFSTANAFTSGQSFTNGHATFLGNRATFGSNTLGSADTSAFGFGTAWRRYCIVNVVFTDGRVSKVNYSGATGGLLTAGEQCAFAVHNCVH